MKDKNTFIGIFILGISIFFVIFVDILIVCLFTIPGVIKKCGFDYLNLPLLLLIPGTLISEMFVARLVIQILPVKSRNSNVIIGLLIDIFLWCLFVLVKMWPTNSTYIIMWEVISLHIILLFLAIWFWKNK